MGNLLSSAVKGALDGASHSHGGASHHQPPPESGSHYRSLAEREFAHAKDLSTRSQAAWQSNDRAAAGELSTQSKSHRAKADEYNRLAADAIFYEKNPGYPNNWEECDLHGLYVSEAMEKVEAHLLGCEKAGVQRTVIITGRGNHSEGGIAKIKPEVQRYLGEQGIGIKEISQGGAMEVTLPGGGQGHVKKGGFRELLKIIFRKLMSGK